MKWKTRDGKKINVSEMSDEHLLNTMKLLYRNGPRIRSAMHSMICQAGCVLTGEMALQLVDDEELRIGNMSDEELVAEQYPILLEMEEEVTKRKI